jgi:hypothetical protein
MLFPVNPLEAARSERTSKELKREDSAPMREGLFETEKKRAAQKKFTRKTYENALYNAINETILSAMRNKIRC